MHKTCTKCATSKPLDMFSKQAKGRYGVTSICKACSSARGLAWHAENRERSIALKKAYRDLHKDEIRARSAAWRINNAARARATAAAWAAANKGKKAAAVAKRRAAKAKATPSWADLDLMQNMYRWAAEATAATGITFEVDHVYPLQSAWVCGLHCWENLLIRTRTSNRSKGNRNFPYSIWMRMDTAEP